MIRIIALTTLLFISNVLLAQHENDIVQFNKDLNQFLNVRDFCISKNGNEAFFTLQSPNQEVSQIACIKKENNIWLEPELVPFCDSYTYLEPFLSANGKRLFFVSDRPIDGTSIKKKDFDIWYVDRADTASDWSAPKNLGKPVNSTFDEFYPSVSKNNNLYFTMESPDGLGKDDIYFCEWQNGTYQKPVLLNENINSNGYEFNAFISKNEDFLLFTKYNEKDGQGSGDLYISKKDEDENWIKAINLGTPINTKYMEYCPFYDAENQILYFTSRRSTLVPKDFSTLLEFQEYVTNNNNGLSKIYKTSLKIE